MRRSRVPAARGAYGNLMRRSRALHSMNAKDRQMSPIGTALMSNLSKSSHYQPDIQGLRALAVFLVIFYHSGLPGMPGGYIGVDVFFVISGFLITGLLLRELERTQTVSLAKFYARRFRRLLPAATVVLAATITMAWFAYSPLELKIFSSSAFATSIYLSNVWFAHLSTDYLAEDTGANPLLHTWSLGVEEQFYLVWPLLILLVFRLGSNDDIHRRLLVAFVLLILSSFALSFWLTQYNQPWAFFGSPTRAWEFGLGGLAALWFSRGALLSRGQALFAGWSGFAMIMVGALAYDRSTAFPGAAALLPVLGATLLIAAAHTKRLRGMSVLLATRPMQFIGDMSYSLYLWHWPVFVLFAAPGEHGDPLISLRNIAVVTLLAWATLALVENPVRFNRRLSSRTVKSLLFGATLTTATAVLAVGIRGIAATNLQDPVQKKFLQARNDKPRIYADDCHLDQYETVPMACTYGAVDSDYTVVLFGDSHAAHWFPAIEQIVNDRGWKLMAFTKSGCPSIMHEPHSELFGRPYTECTQWRERVIGLMQEMHPQLVVVSNINSYENTAEEWRDQTRKLLNTLAPISDRIVIISDTPHAVRSVPNCLSRAAWRGVDYNQHCQAKVASDRATAVRAAEKAAAAPFANVSVVDLSEIICPTTPCPVYEDGVIRYSDGSHLTATYSRLLTTQLAPFLVDR